MLTEIDKAVKSLKAIEDSFIDLKQDSSFLLVYQTKLQSDWLKRFGNTITCMDAVYKTLRYGFPCFFLVVKTSIGVGRVVGTIIPQFETEELIAEGLQVIKKWNPLWSPKYFMTDKSAQELGLWACENSNNYSCNYYQTTGAIALVHPECIRLVCDFHSLQAVERWTNKSQNGVRHEDKCTVKSLFKQLLYASSGG